MSIRKIIFCDKCNPQGLRAIEYRRAPRNDQRTGRRISDGRSWFEGELSAALQAGWVNTGDGGHICPACKLNKF